ncbi:MAG: HEPN domain-containing protein [Myxococcales bacterium]
MVEKARRSIHAAEVLLAQGEPEIAAGRAYYAMFYAAEALLQDRGLHFKRHSGVHTAFGEHFIKTDKLDAKLHRWLIDAFDQRIGGDYDAEASFSNEDVEGTIQRAREFLQAVRDLFERGPK